MNEEERIFAGKLFCPGNPMLKAIKLKTHNLDIDFNHTHEDDYEERSRILHEIVGELGDGFYFHGPIYFHYGKHTRIGKNFFANFNLTIQDDAPVTIGDNCNFGPNTSIVTPIHPLIGEERRLYKMPDGSEKHLCYAKPVNIGNDVWFGASVTVCPGVTIGNGCVIGAGSVVTHDIPDNTFAAGVPAKVIRSITEKDSLDYKKDLF